LRPEKDMSDSSDKRTVFSESFLTFIISQLFMYDFGEVPELFLMDHFRNLCLRMSNLNLRVPWHPEIALDYVGFFIPLVTSIILLALSWKVRPHFSTHERRLFFIYTGLFIVGESISAVLPEILKASWTAFQTDGHMNPISVVIACIYSAYVITLESEKFSYAVSYIIGFSMSVMGDVSAVLAGTVGVFGFYGFTDGDFIEPLVMVLAAFFMMLLIHYERKKGVQVKGTEV